MAAAQRRDGFAAAFERHEAHLLEVHAGRLAVRAAFIQSWLPTVPPAPSTILVGSCLKASIRLFRSVYGESLRTTATP